MRLTESAVFFSPNSTTIRIDVFLPSIPTLFFRSTWNQRSNCDPILVAVHVYRILQLAVVDCCPLTNHTFIRPTDAWIQGIPPSVVTLSVRSTWNQRGDCDPILATVRSYRILQLGVFVFFPCSRTSIYSVDAGIQFIVPSGVTLSSRSTRNQSGNCDPILATVRLYRIFQLDVFVFCPFTLAFIRQVDIWIKGLAPSAIKLWSRSTRNQRRNCTPILATVCLYRIFQLAIFVF
jgi:hypothetical protein